MYCNTLEYTTKYISTHCSSNIKMEINTKVPGDDARTLALLQTAKKKHKIIMLTSKSELRLKKHAL